MEPEGVWGSQSRRAVNAESHRQRLAVGVQGRIEERQLSPLCYSTERLLRISGRAQLGAAVLWMLAPCFACLGKHNTVALCPSRCLPLLSLVRPRDPLQGTQLKRLPDSPRRTFWDDRVTQPLSRPFCLGEDGGRIRVPRVPQRGEFFELKVNSALIKGNSCCPRPMTDE